MLSTIFFSFALIICPSIALCQDDTCSLASAELRQCGCKKNKVKHTRTELDKVDDQRCGICHPQPAPTVEPSDETTETKCGCGRPKKSIDVKCGICHPQPAPAPSEDETTETKCGCGRPKKSIDTKCGICYPQSAPTPAQEPSDETADTKCGICHPQPPQPSELDNQDEETKRIRPDEILEGVAQACLHAGCIAGAPTKREQKQAMCNLVGSIFNLAAQITKRENKSPQEHHRSIKLVTHYILHHTEQGQIRSELLCGKPYLTTIKSLEKISDRDEVINQILKEPQDCQAFLEELFTTVKSYLTANGTTLYQALDEAFSTLIEQADCTHRSPEAMKKIQTGKIELRNTSGKPVHITLEIKNS